MARYAVTVRTPLDHTEAFAYMADLRNFAEWDPGVRRVRQVRGDGAGAEAAFDVVVKGIVGELTLTYEVTEYDEPNETVVVAKSPFLTSVDRITVVPEGNGSLVTYDAELTLNGLAGLFEPFLGLVFDRIGDKAADGLLDALDGERVEATTEVV